MLDFRDVPLRRKLTIISTLSTGVALLMACGAFVVYEMITFKRSMVADLTSAAAIVGHNSAAALAFDDPDSASRTLQSLSTDPHILGAALYDKGGRPFAEYRRPDSATAFGAPPRVEASGSRFDSDRLRLFYAFDWAGEPAGTVYIEADKEALRESMARYGLIGLFVMLVTSGVAVLLAGKLQRVISGPVSDLAAVVNVVRANSDYSVRAAKPGNDELGSLIEGFNAMLEQIQAQDRALQDARDQLERRVAERTQALRQEIVEREAAQAKLVETHRQLMEASRQAGMAEVATNVLHNVGNVLNSVNVSAAVIAERVERSRVTSLEKLAALLDEHSADLSAFITADPRGKHVPAYLGKLAEHLIAERGFALEELESLRRNIDHIKEIVAMQLSYAKVSGVSETTDVVELLEDALRINGTSLDRHGIEVVRDYAEVPRVETEKHKVLQILVNLIRNAKDACTASARPDKRITLRVTREAASVRVAIADNGIGIAPECRHRIFEYGFTTKKDGHGFGLHSGALSAHELGGELSAESGGVDCGATFTLELPVETV